MHERFSSDAVDHCGCDGVVVGSAAEQGADVYFTAFEEAGAEHAFSGEAQAIAGGAEGGGHGADKTDSTGGFMGQPVDIRGADPGFLPAVYGNESAEFGFNVMADFSFGDEGVLTAVLSAATPGGPAFGFVHEGGITKGHKLDEADGDRQRLGEAGEVGEFRVVGAAHGDAVDLRAGETGVDCAMKPAEYRIQITGASDCFEAVWLQAVDADGDAVQPGFFEGPGQVGQLHAVGGEGQFFESLYAAQAVDQVDQVVANGGFTTGELDSADAMNGNSRADHALDLFEAEDIFLGQPADALLGHAVDASEIAAICDADAQHLYCEN